MEAQIVSMLSSLQMGDAFELQMDNGSTITLYLMAPGSFAVVQSNDTDLPVHSQLMMADIPDWFTTIDERSILGFGVVKNMNAGHRRRQLNLGSVKNGRANAISNDTEFINANFMPLNRRPANKSNYIYLESELRGGKAVRAYHKDALKALDAEATNPFTRRALDHSNFRKVV